MKRLIAAGLALSALLPSSAHAEGPQGCWDEENLTVPINESGGQWEHLCGPLDRMPAGAERTADDEEMP